MIKCNSAYLIPSRSDASLDFFINGVLVAQNVPFEDRHCSNLRNCFICNASEESCVLWSCFLVSSVLPGSISSVTNSHDKCVSLNDVAGVQSTCSKAGCNQCDWDITINGSCDSVLLQIILRKPSGAGGDIAEASGFGFSSVFSLEPFNSAAIESCNRAAHSRDIARSLRVGDAFADVVFKAEGVRFPAHKVFLLTLMIVSGLLFFLQFAYMFTFLQVIVAARCVHFRSMFNSRMREALQVWRYF